MQRTSTTGSGKTKNLYFCASYQRGNDKLIINKIPKSADFGHLMIFILTSKKVS